MIVLIPLPRSLMTENATCSFGIDMGGGNYAISSCDINIVFVEVIANLKFLAYSIKR